MFIYENMEVYKKASHVNLVIFDFLKKNNTISVFIKNQLGRASLSVMLNIAEGSAKLTNRSRRNFYDIARGSACESDALVKFLFQAKQIEEDFKISLCNQYEEISKMLFRLIKNLDAKINKKKE